MREAPAIAAQVAEGLPDGSALGAAARDAFTIGMRYALFVGVGLLLLGALFVWIRGASRRKRCPRTSSTSMHPVLRMPSTPTLLL